MIGGMYQIPPIKPKGDLIMSTQRIVTNLRLIFDNPDI